MSVAYYIQTEGVEHFVMKAPDHKTVAGPFETLGDAWYRAEEMAGPDGIYTTLPDNLMPHDDPRPRACWLER